MADREHDCDILLDQNLYQDMDSRYAGKTPRHCTTLLGPRFALLRPDFRQGARPWAAHRSARSAADLLGGIDAHNYTAMAMAAVDAARFTGST